MNNNDYLFLIGLCAVFGGLLGFSDEIVKNKWIQKKIRTEELKWFKTKSRLLFKIISYLILAFLGIFLTISKEEHNKSESIKELKQQESIAEKKRLESNKDIVKNFSDGLAKYYLKYDFENKKVQRIIKGSIKNVTKNNTRPELNIYEIAAERLNDTIKYKITFSATQQALYNLKAKLYLVDRNKYDKLNYDGFINVNLKKMTTDSPFIKTLRASDKEQLTKKMYFFLDSYYEPEFDN